MVKKGLTQANTLRSNNTTSTGYGIVYADEIIGSRSVKTKEDLNKLPDWVLGKDNKLEKGTTYYVENEKCFYIYTGSEWKQSFKSIGLPVKSWYAYDNDITGTAATSQILDISKIIKGDDLYVGTQDGIEEQPHPFATIVVYNDEVNKVPIAYITLFESSDPDNPENNTVVASAKVFGVITKNVFPKTPDFNNINYYEGNCRPLDTGTQITNWKHTGGNSIVDKVGELNHLSFTGNTIKTSEIDFTAATLQKFNNSVSDTSHNICAQYSVVDVTHNNIVGQMLLIGDSLGHMVTEILTTSATLNNGVINWNEHSDTVVNTYIRRNHVKEGGNSSIAVGSWSTWTYYSGESQFNDFKILVAKELNKKVNTSDIVQQTGDSTTSVMSQKAVTDAIQAEIDRATAAEKANAQAIAEEKAATQVKVEVLNRKIDAQKNEINVAKEEALQAIAKNEQSAITNFNSQRVTPEMLSESTKQLIEASGGGTITNLPDDEDLTSVDDGTGSNVLKFADKTYNPDNFSGKGYKRLRKNIKKINLAVTKITVNSIPNKDGEISITINSINTHISLIKDVHNTPALVAKTISDTLASAYKDYDIEVTDNIITLTRKHSGEVTSSVFDVTDTEVILNIEDSVKSVNRNILTKNMLNGIHTIYEIRYDFDLDGETITWLGDVTLDFTKGGSLNNGTISAGVCIKGIIRGNAVFRGNVSYIIHSSYFDNKENSYLNVIIDKLMSFLGNNRFGMNCVLILDRNYIINGTLILPNVISIDGANHSISFTSNTSEGIIVKKTTNSTTGSSFIKNIIFVGDPTNGYILNLKSTCIIDNIYFYKATRFIKCTDYIDNINISNIYCSNRNLGDDINIVLGRGEAINVQNINDGISIFKYMGQITMKNIINPYIYLYNCKATLDNMVFETGFVKLYYSRVIFTNLSISSNLGRSQYSLEINNPEIKQVVDSSLLNFNLSTLSKSTLVFINSGAKSNSYIFPPKYKDFQDIKSFDDNFIIEGNPLSDFSFAYSDKIDNAVISHSNYGQVVSANKGYSIHNPVSISTKVSDLTYTRSDYYKNLANDHTNYNCDLRKYAFIKAVVLFDENRKIGYETSKQRVISNGINFSIINIQNAQDGQCIVFYLLDETDRVLKKSRILYYYGNNILFTDYGIGSSPLQDCDNIDSYEECLNFTCMGDNVICKLNRVPEVGTWKEGDIAEVNNIRYIFRNNTWLLDNVYKLETSKRPSLKSNDEGFEYYDTILKKKILWNGSAWVNLDGTELS